MSIDCSAFCQLFAAFALCVSTTAHASTHTSGADTYLTSAELSCSETLSQDSDACYQESLMKLARIDEPSATPESVRYSATATKAGYSRYSMLAGHRPKRVTISIHGLWGNTEQFAGILNEISERDHDGAGNLIQLTLPGHLKGANFRDKAYNDLVKSHPPFATYQEWLTALDETMSVAKIMGDEVTIVGQSTGGLLAVVAALKYPKQVKNVVLVEPALRVRPILNFGSCTLGKALDTSPFLRSVGKLVHRAFPAGTNVQMGCEVQKLDNALLEHFPSTSSDKKENYVDRIQQLAKKITQPVFLINNEHDNVVNNEINKAFYISLPGWKHYQSINLDGKHPHGWITEIDPMMIAFAMLEVRFQPTSDEAVKLGYALVIQQEFRKSVVRMGGLYNAAQLQLEQTKFLNADYGRRFCEFLKSEAECTSVKNGVQMLNDIWNDIIRTRTGSRSKSDYFRISAVADRIKTAYRALQPGCDAIDDLTKSYYGGTVKDHATCSLDLN
jgi:pimeloyl-ACP methyl ester carboxylesterase